MLYQDTFNQFLNDVETSNLRVIENKYDLCIYPVDNWKISHIRYPFKLHVDEEVLYVRDTGLWTNGDQGIVVTDWGINYIPDNDEPENVYQLAWADYDYAEYKGGSIFFFKGNDRSNPFDIPITYFLKDLNDNNGQILATIFSNMAATQNGDNAYKALERLSKAFEEANYQLAIEEADNVLSMSSEEDVIRQAKEYKARAFHEFAMSFNWDDNTPEDERCLQIQNREHYSEIADQLYEEIEQIEGEQEWIDFNRGLLLCGGTPYDNIQQARRLFISAMKSENTELQKNASDYYDAITDFLFESYDEYYDKLPEYLKNSESEEEKEICIKETEKTKFTNSEDVSDRQFLMFAKNKKQIAGCYDRAENIKWIFTLDRIPKDLVFEGVPSINTLYMVHPIKKDTYLQYENAEEKLFMEKVREFCFLVQCLGATEVTFRSLKGKNIEQEKKYVQEIAGNVETMLIDANGQYNRSGHESINIQSNKEVNLKQCFSPNQKPYCPKGLIWYDYDSEWSLLVKQRLEGGIISYNYRIRSSDTCNLSSNHISDLKASFERLLLTINGNYKSNTDTTFSKHDEKEWEISVVFKPLEDFNCDLNDTKTVNLMPKLMNSNEEEYLQEVKDIFSDGEISSRERRLLEKIRIRLGISESRAKEIEESIRPKLNEYEQEYYDEYKEIIAEGDISPRDQRFLDKLKKANGISDGRAKEIEAMLQNQS